MTRPLTVAPTPLEAMDRLAGHLGRPPGSLFVKRDDATGLAGGGTKTRMLDHICRAAVADGVDWLVTAGGEQSNHARMTAAAAVRLGLGCTVVLTGTAPPTPSGNLLLDHLLGADVRHVEVTDDGVDAVCHGVADELAATGRRPLVVPLGACTPEGMRGVVDLAEELLAQRPDVDCVVVATGAGGLQAGLAVGFGDHDRVLGVHVGTWDGITDLVARRADEAADALELPRPSGRPVVDLDWRGPGYGVPTPDTIEAIELLARCEGLVVDPVYTGKAAAGLIGRCRRGELDDEVVVLLHGGGDPALHAARYHDRWMLDQGSRPS